MKLKIVVDGKAYEVDVDVPEEDLGSPSYASYRPPYAPTPTSAPAGAPAVPVAAKSPSSAETVADESKVCRSPIAGVVIRVNVQEGQQIQPDDLLLVLEAMKMETNVTAPIAGKIKQIKVNPGDGVQVNQVLVEFE